MKRRQVLQKNARDPFLLVITPHGWKESNLQSTWFFLRWACHFLQGVGFLRSGCPRPWGLATEGRGWTARLGSHTLSGPAPGPRGQLKHRAESTSRACGETLRQQDAACHPQPPALRCPLCPQPAGSIPSLGHLLETTHQQKPPPAPHRPLRRPLEAPPQSPQQLFSHSVL